MSVKKTFNITLDVSSVLTNEEFRVKQGDTGNVFVVTLKDGSSPVDLSNCRVVAVFTHGDSLAMQDNWTDDGGISISGDSHNIITIDLFNGSFVPGLNECEIQVYSGEELDTLITSAAFNFRCARTLFNEETILALKEYSILTSLISSVQRIVNGVQSNWSESDSTDAAFIKNKPTSFTPSAHATAHASGGADAFLHALQHAHGEADAITPTSIKAVGFDTAQTIAESDQVTARGNIGATNKVSETVSLTAAGWMGNEAPFTQQLLVNSIPATCDIIVSPAVGAEEVYGECEIKATAHESRKITFSCGSKPDAAVSVNLLILS